MNKKTNKFGLFLKNLRTKNGLTLREVCESAHYDYSNWSKVERGKLSPPSDIAVLKDWADALKLKKGTEDYQNFLDEALIAQGVIPEDILNDSEVLQYLPAFFRTVRNRKPTKEEIEELIENIKSV